MIRGKFLALDDFDLAGQRLLNWKWLNDLPTDGAVDGQALVYTGGSVKWATLSASGVVNVDWASLTGVPTTFPPEAHDHVVSDINDFPATWSYDDLTDVPLVFTPDDHTHVVTEITDFPTTWSYTDLTDVPTEFTPEAHTHVVTEITDFPTTWAWTDLTGIPSLVNTVSGGTNINVSTSTGDVVISAPNAITSLTAGTNISVNGTTISVVATPTFDGTVNVGGNLILDGNLDIGGDIAMTTGGPITGATTVTAGQLRSSGDIYANYGGPDGDSYLYFYEGGSASGAYMRWVDSSSFFILSHQLRVDGDFYAYDNIRINFDGPEGDGILYFYDGGSSIGQDLRWDDSVSAFQFSSTLRINGNMQCFQNAYLGFGGPEGDSYLYFYEGGSSTGAWLRFDDSRNEFNFDHRLRILADTENIALALESTDSQCIIQIIDPDGYANITQDGNEIYLQPGGSSALGAFSNQNVRVYGNFLCDGYAAINYGGPDGDGFLYFYDDSSNSGEYLKWDDAADRFEFSDDVNIGGELSASSAEIVGNIVSTNGELLDALRTKQGSDQSSTSTSPVNSGLSFPVGTNSTYVFDVLLLVQGDSLVSPDAVVGISAPSGSTYYWHEGLQDGGQTPRTTGRAVIEIDGTDLMMHRISGILETGGTLGTMYITWAQNTSSANAVIIKSASTIVAHRIT